MGNSDYSNFPLGMHQENEELNPTAFSAPPRIIGSKSLTAKRAQSQGNKGVGRSGRKACAVANPSPSTPHTNRSKTLQKAIAAKPDPFKKHWRNLWQHEKLSVASEAASGCGGVAFSLNLSRKRQEMLLGRADPAGDLRRYISREMRNSFGCALPFSFTFEISPTGTLHLHGVVVPHTQSADHLRQIGDAFAKAGGKITGRGAARQVCLKPLTDGYGWATYSQKAFDEACSVLGTYKVTFISDDLTRMAREIHTARRAEVLHTLA